MREYPANRYIIGVGARPKPGETRPSLKNFGKYLGPLNPVNEEQSLKLLSKKNPAKTSNKRKEKQMVDGKKITGVPDQRSNASEGRKTNSNASANPASGERPKLTPEQPVNRNQETPQQKSDKS